MYRQYIVILVIVITSEVSRSEVGGENKAKKFTLTHDVGLASKLFLFFTLHFLICSLLLKQTLNSWYLSAEKCPLINEFILKVNKKNFSFIAFVPKPERNGEYNVHTYIF